MERTKVPGFLFTPLGRKNLTKLTVELDWAEEYLFVFSLQNHLKIK
jgi:hypothetical protein